MQSASRVTKPPKPAPPDPAGDLRRFSVAEYDEMIRVGIIQEDEHVELIHGWLLQVMPANPAHKKSLRHVLRVFAELIPDEFVIDTQAPVAIGDSRPEPDVAVAIGPEDRYDDRHAGPGDLVLVVEVSDTSLAYDRGEKLALYATAKVPVYWIVNLIDRQVEVYSAPRGGKNPTYRQSKVYASGEPVPVLLRGTSVGTVAMDDLLPN